MMNPGRFGIYQLISVLTLVRNRGFNPNPNHHVANLCGDNLAELKTWTPEDWNKYRQ
jgi:hypothetical protein